MNVKYLRSIVSNAADVPAVLDHADVPFSAIESVNWKEQYPYQPFVNFRMAYNATSILLHFKVTEDSVRGKHVDNGNVWTDSCVEFFCIPADDGIYYNLECNCIGSILIGAGKDRSNRERAEADVLGSVQRWSSLGRKTIDEVKGLQTWEVALIIPFTAFFKHRIRSMAGKTIKANFYKCGDELAKPHFLSWNPIQLEKPNFHCPQFFGSVSFISE